MALKYRYSKKDEVPAELSSMYVERDGAFVLDVDGVVKREKLDEFRQNNIRLNNELKRFEGIDVDRAKELLKKQEDLEEQNLIKSGDLEKIVENKLAPLRADLERERSEKQRLQGELERFTLNQTLQTAGAKAGLRATAVPDLLARAGGVFTVVNGQVVANEPAVTLDVWLEVLKTEATHLFESSSGGGAAGNGSGGAGLSGRKNPFKKETWNLTEQSNQKLTSVAMHSDTEGFLRKRDLIDTIPDAEGKPVITSPDGYERVDFGQAHMFSDVVLLALSRAVRVVDYDWHPQGGARPPGASERHAGRLLPVGWSVSRLSTETVSR